MNSIDDLWNNGNEIDWHDALKNYWRSVKPSHLAIEKEFDQIDSNKIKMMNSDEWYEFLLHKYYFWKYTAPNRYATTTGQLRKYIIKQNGLDELKAIKTKHLTSSEPGLINKEQAILFLISLLILSILCVVQMKDWWINYELKEQLI